MHSCNLHEGKVGVQVPISKQSRIPRIEANLDLISLIITIQYSFVIFVGIIYSLYSLKFSSEYSLDVAQKYSTIAKNI